VVEDGAEDGVKGTHEPFEGSKGRIEDTFEPNDDSTGRVEDATVKLKENWEREVDLISLETYFSL